MFEAALTSRDSPSGSRIAAVVGPPEVALHVRGLEELLRRHRAGDEPEVPIRLDLISLQRREEERAFR